jgi:hypothetical protein
MYQHFNVQPTPPSKYNTQLSAAVDRVLLRALAKKPEDRFPSIAAFASEFEQAMRLLPADLVVRPPQPNTDDTTEEIRSTLAISHAEAQSGTSRMITLPGGQQVKVSIPAGAYDGQVIRMRNPDETISAAGELILTIAVAPPEKAHQALHTLSDERTMLTPQSGVQRPSPPSPDHDLPTVASSNPQLRAPEVQLQPPAPKRRSAPMTIGIISGLIILLLLAGSVYFYSNYQSQQAGARALAQSQTATALAQTPKQTPTPTATPRPAPGLFIAGTYNGSMTDATTQQVSSISILIKQSQGSGLLSGTFTNRSLAQGVYPLTGKIDMQGNFSFRVQQAGGQQPLYFYGSLNQGVYLKGFFCSSSTNSCGANNTNPNFFIAGPRF